MMAFCNHLKTHRKSCQSHSNLAKGSRFPELSENPAAKYRVICWSPNGLRKHLCANYTKDQNSVGSWKQLPTWNYSRAQQVETSARFNHFWDLLKVFTLFRVIFCLSSVDLLIIFLLNERGRLDGKLLNKLFISLNKAFCWDLRGHVFHVCFQLHVFLSSEHCYSNKMVLITPGRLTWQKLQFSAHPGSELWWLFQFWH